jgi:hypothetical protein
MVMVSSYVLYFREHKYILICKGGSNSITSIQMSYIHVN